MESYMDPYQVKKYLSSYMRCRVASLSVGDWTRQMNKVLFMVILGCSYQALLLYSYTSEQNDFCLFKLIFDLLLDILLDLLLDLLSDLLLNLLLNLLLQL